MRKQLVPFGIALLVVFAGCLSGANTQDSPPTITPPTPSNWSDQGDPNLGSNRFLNLSIGKESDFPDGVASHYYLIGNNQSETRSIRITVWRYSTVVLNRSVEFPSDGVLKIEVFRPGNYTLVIDPASSSRHVIDAPDTWDCNYRGVEAAVQPDGSLSAFTLQSQILCRTITKNNSS